MKSLYEIICVDLLKDQTQDIINGGSVMGLHFDFEKKDIRSRRKFLMKEGKVVPQVLKLTDGSQFTLKEDMPLLPDREFDVQILYDKYVNSKPSTMNNYERGYFTPKTSDELPFKVLVSGENRVKARYELEGYILLGIVSGKLKWQTPEHWFWRGNNGLIMYKEWFE